MIQVDVTPTPELDDLITRWHEADAVARQWMAYRAQLETLILGHAAVSAALTPSLPSTQTRTVRVGTLQIVSGPALQELPPGESSALVQQLLDRLLDPFPTSLHRPRFSRRPIDD